MLLLSLLIPLLNWLLVVSPLSTGDTAMVTAGKVMAAERLYRVGIAVDLVITVTVIVLALCFYAMLEPVNRILASVALSLKLAEAILWAASALVTVIALQVLKGRSSLTVFAPEQLQDAAGLFLAVRHAGNYVPMVFLSLGSTVFFYLFFTSGYMPRPLAAFGMLAYALLLVPALANVLAPPESAKELATGALQLVGALPSVLAEITIGLWLVVKGGDGRPRDALRVGAA